jgi:ferredoxin
LAGLGYPPALERADRDASLSGIPALPESPPLALPDSDDKRTLLFAALDHLVEHGNAVPRVVDLSVVGAPMGDVSLDKGRCTLCGTCVNICPSGALTFPAADRIAFVESRCLQCGLCAKVCPERAVAMTPRLITDHTARSAPRLVAEAEMFTCDDCGQAFAPRAMVERSRAMMAGHPMFEGDRARLMDLCPACRQRAISMA